MFSTPEVSGGKLFVGSCSGRFYAIGAESGSLIWDYDITMDGDQTSFHGDMIITENAVLIGTDDGEGHIYSFDQTSGEANWKFPAGRGASSDIILHEDRVYGVTLEDHLVCLDLESGELLWRLETGANTAGRTITGSTPAVVDGTVYYGGRDGVLHALDARTGKEIWKTEIDGQIVTSTLYLDGALFVGTDYSEIHRIDPESGEVEKTIFVDYPVRGHFLPTPDGMIVAFIADSDWEGELICFDSSLELKWGITAPDGSTFVSARPFLLDRWILAGTGTGNLFAISATTGMMAWKHTVDPDRDWVVRGVGVGVFGSHDSTLFVGTISGAVYAFDTKLLRYWGTEDGKN